MAMIPATADPARGSSGSAFLYPQLTATNYTSWVIRVQAMMEDQGVWEAIEPADGANVDARKDKKVKSHLLQSLPEDLLMQVAKKKTAKEVWDCLKTRFVGADRVRNARLQTLKGEFGNMVMDPGETLDQYAGHITAMGVRHSALGSTLSDSAMVKKLFDTVPEKYVRRFSLAGERSSTVVAHHGAAHWLCIDRVSSSKTQEDYDDLYKLSAQVGTATTRVSMAKLPFRARGSPLLVVSGDGSKLLVACVFRQHVRVRTQQQQQGLGDDVWLRTVIRILTMAVPYPNYQEWSNLGRGSMLLLCRNSGVFILDSEKKVMDCFLTQLIMVN